MLQDAAASPGEFIIQMWPMKPSRLFLGGVAMIVSHVIMGLVKSVSTGQQALTKAA